MACVKRGDLRSIKSGLKRKIVDIPALLLLNCAQVFTRGEGGIGGPNSPYGALGSPCKNSHNLFYQINFKDPRICFLRLLLHSFLYGPYVRERIETGSKIFTIQQKKLLTMLHMVSPGVSVA